LAPLHNSQARRRPILPPLAPPLLQSPSLRRSGAPVSLPLFSPLQFLLHQAASRLNAFMTGSAAMAINGRLGTVATPSPSLTL
jgi:hypothetical protein